jgi:hypothetical protein
MSEYDWKKVAQVGGIGYSQSDIDTTRSLLRDCIGYPITGEAVLSARERLIMLAYDASKQISEYGKATIRDEIIKTLDGIIYGFVRDMIKESEVEDEGNA